MDTISIYGSDGLDKKYLSKCLRRLKEWNAPLHGWACKKITDVREDDQEAPLSVCELCDCGKVRYEHVMEHEHYFEPVIVGCVCAGIMEGDILKAKERERLMRNRSKRRRNFVKRPWTQRASGAYFREYKGRTITITEQNGFFRVHTVFGMAATYKGKEIRDFLSASYAAFDIVDPIEDIL